MTEQSSPSTIHRSGSTLADARATLESILADRAPHLPFAWGRFVVLSGLLVTLPTAGDAEARFLVVDDTGSIEDGYPWQVSLARFATRGWLLHRFEPRCTDCFGAGINHMGNDRQLCEGKGWGGIGIPSFLEREQLPV